MEQHKEGLEYSIGLMWGLDLKSGRYSIGNNLSTYLKKRLMATYVSKKKMDDM